MCTGALVSRMMDHHINLGDLMPLVDHETLERLAYDAWLRRGRPMGSPEVDWDEACKLVEENRLDQEPPPPTAPGSLPTDLGAEPPPELSHAIPRARWKS